MFVVETKLNHDFVGAATSHPVRTINCEIVQIFGLQANSETLDRLTCETKSKFHTVFRTRFLGFAPTKTPPNCPKLYAFVPIVPSLHLQGGVDLDHPPQMRVVTKSLLAGA